jgi:hypothetical protein
MGHEMATYMSVCVDPIVSNLISPQLIYTMRGSKLQIDQLNAGCEIHCWRSAVFVKIGFVKRALFIKVEKFAKMKFEGYQGKKEGIALIAFVAFVNFTEIFKNNGTPPPDSEDRCFEKVFVYCVFQKNHSMIGTFREHFTRAFKLQVVVIS